MPSLTAIIGFNNLTLGSNQRHEFLGERYVFRHMYSNFLFLMVLTCIFLSGINTLISIMSRFGRNLETESKITHNERLEFLGDAVVEFLTSIHLFHLFPSLEEGGLATYRYARLTYGFSSVSYVCGN